MTHWKHKHEIHAGNKREICDLVIETAKPTTGTRIRTKVNSAAKISDQSARYLLR